MTASSLIRDFWSVKPVQALLLFSLSFMLYVNTLGHDYTQDDAIVIYENMFTTQGFKGIPGIWQNDTFYGFFKVAGKANLVSGGRYRPVSQTMFAMEWALFGNNPLAGHLMNVLLFSLLIVLIYRTLLLLFNELPDQTSIAQLAFVAALVFAVHPIHTEVVANIKGRDELLSLIFSLATLWLLLKGTDTKKITYVLAAVPVFLLGMLSKENAITFAAIIPLAIWLFRKKEQTRWIQLAGALIIPVALFLWIRHAILGFDLGSQSMELMNNPFLKLEGGKYIPFSLDERMATILYTLGKYLQLLVFPHPLTHDYYPRHIPMMTFSDWRVLASGLLYTGGMVWALWRIRKNRIPAFSVIYYLITLSIVSNLVFPIGTNMSERFLFMPSLGFALGVSWLWYTYLPRGKWIFILAGLLIVGLLGIKTIDRNRVWKDDFTLFTTDVKTSSNSAKVLNAAGGALVNRASKEKNTASSVRMLQEAKSYLEKAIRIHPMYKNAWLILGNAHYYLKEYDDAIDAFKAALTIDPDFTDATKNLGISYREAGKYYGQEKNDLAQALIRLKEAYQLMPEDYETVRLYGIANALSGNNQAALSLFQQAVTLAPQNAGAYVNLGNIYYTLGDEENGRKNHALALELDPEIFEKK